jgi:PAS domain-containing protein
MCLIEDISERKASEQVLHEQERSTSVLLSHIPGMAYRCKDDIEWTMEFVSEGCFALTGYAEESLIGNAEVSYKDVIAPEYRQRVWEDWCIFRQHPDTETGIIRTAYRNYPDSVSETSGHLAWLTN